LVFLPLFALAGTLSSMAANSIQPGLSWRFSGKDAERLVNVGESESDLLDQASRLSAGDMTRRVKDD
jgi:hypothetical protein